MYPVMLTSGFLDVSGQVIFFTENDLVFSSGAVTQGMVYSGMVYRQAAPFHVGESLLFQMEQTMSSVEVEMVLALAASDEAQDRREYADFLDEHGRRHSAELVRKGFIPGLGMVGMPLPQ